MSDRAPKRRSPALSSRAFAGSSWRGTWWRWSGLIPVALFWNRSRILKRSRFRQWCVGGDDCGGSGMFASVGALQSWLSCKGSGFGSRRFFTRATCLGWMRLAIWAAWKSGTRLWHLRGWVVSGGGRSFGWSLGNVRVSAGCRGEEWVKMEPEMVADVGCLNGGLLIGSVCVELRAVVWRYSRVLYGPLVRRRYRSGVVVPG